ncbi:MAG: glycosyltransferase [Candidatus Saccharimonadales bacterium]
MRIGIFTDTYHPTINGITFVVDETKRELEALGHEVFVVAPGIKIKRVVYDEASRILRIPAIKDVFFEDQMTSFFFPPKQVKRIRELQLDVIEFTTPGQIGMLGVYAALKNDTPLVAMYCTDLYEYIRHYPRVVPAVIAQVMGSPLTLGAKAPELRKLLTSLSQRDETEHWTQKLVAEMLTVLHNRCQAVVSPSRKVAAQLRAWKTTAPIHVIPTGITPLGTDQAAIDKFRKRWGLGAKDKIILNVGRLGSEKNLELAIRAFDQIKLRVPEAKLILVGDSNQHVPLLKELAAEQTHAQDIIFTGKIARSELGAAYASGDVFVFPSLTDTQGLVLHEATQLGLPLVICDPEVTEVLQDGVNGYFAHNDVDDFAQKVADIISNPVLSKTMGAESRRIVAHYTAAAQAQKLLEVLEEATITVLDKK